MENRLYIEQCLKQSINVRHIEVMDNSHQHIGHKEASGGKGHFAVIIVSEDFKGKSLIQRHRLIQGFLKGYYETFIHALEIKAFTSDEFCKKQ